MSGGNLKCTSERSPHQCPVKGPNRSDMDPDIGPAARTLQSILGHEFLTSPPPFSSHTLIREFPHAPVRGPLPVDFFFNGENCAPQLGHMYGSLAPCNNACSGWPLSLNSRQPQQTKIMIENVGAKYISWGQSFFSCDSFHGN